MMLEVLRQDYIRTAWAKGLKERVVVVRHALKNALIPLVTLVTLQINGTIGGAVVVEQIFGLPGLGRLIIASTTKRDYPIISGVVLGLALFVMLMNLLTDLTYAYLNPKIRY
jgi:peptide/nickel transport system permease protein